mmetsp:Transcript_33135/g.93804  ORF Transcript_33135/g.93804 Transcript_33135/m.93804 type:complete len:162 (-) Transcript_33135:1662-2147(-)
MFRQYHASLGVVPEMLLLLQEALMNVAMQTLKPTELWDVATKDAWQGFCCAATTTYIQQLPSEEWTLYNVTASWYSMVAEGLHLGAVEAFYKAMLSSKPALQSMFKRPFHSQTEMFTEGTHKGFGQALGAEEFDSVREEAWGAFYDTISRIFTEVLARRPC